MTRRDLRRGARRARRRLRVTLRPLAPRELVHRAGLRGELRWWRGFIETGGGAWPEDLHHRLDPDAPVLESLLADRLDRFDDRIRVLDVGAGPVSVLGKVHGGRRLEITAVDPLGEQYARLLTRAAIEPPVRTEACAGEDVAERFGSGVFDIAYSRNAVDHSADPVAVVRAMLETVAPGGFVALRHYRCEGESNGYVDLHNWNFDIVDGALLIWGPYGSHDLSAHLGGVTCWLEEDSGRTTPWVCAIVEKPARPARA